MKSKYHSRTIMLATLAFFGITLTACAQQGANTIDGQLVVVIQNDAPMTVKLQGYDGMDRAVAGCNPDMFLRGVWFNIDWGDGQETFFGSGPLRMPCDAFAFHSYAKPGHYKIAFVYGVLGPDDGAVPIYKTTLGVTLPVHH